MSKISLLYITQSRVEDWEWCCVVKDHLFDVPQRYSCVYRFRRTGAIEKHVNLSSLRRVSEWNMGKSIWRQNRCSMTGEEGQVPIRKQRSQAVTSRWFENGDHEERPHILDQHIADVMCLGVDDDEPEENR